MNDKRKLIIAGSTLIFGTYLYGFKHGFRAARNERITEVTKSLDIAQLCTELMEYVAKNVNNDAITQEEFEQTIAEKQAFIETLNGL